MSGDMQKFVSLKQAYPAKRKAKDRLGDFGEIYESYAPEKAAEQASRCSQCGVPFCQINCPLENNIPDWLRLAAADRLEEAYRLSAATNNMPEVCGRICPQDRLCEGSCVIEKGFSSVTIGSVERYLTDTAWEKGWIEPLKPGADRGTSVAVIGAGPAGLAAAEELRLRGYGVDIYDRYDRPGGMLIYGIPDFKLEKHIVERRSKRLAEGGVGFHMEQDVGAGGVAFAELRERFDAVLIATGTYKARQLKLPGAGMPGTIRAMDYLTAANRICLGDTVPAFDDCTLNAKDKAVVVVGGGDTAMDCVRTAVRQGARSVKCLYRRDRENMPGSAREVVNAEEEGVEFVWLAAPKALHGKDRVTEMKAERMRLGSPDASGRRRPEPLKGSDFKLDADMVIEALGFEAEDLPKAFGEKGLSVGAGGTIDADAATLMTSLDGVFAAGDIVRGPSLVVWAIRDGRLAARRIHRYLLNKAGLKAEPDPDDFFRTFEHEYAL